MSERKRGILPRWVGFTAAALALLGLAHMTPLRHTHAQTPDQPYVQYLIKQTEETQGLQSMPTDMNADGLPDIIYHMDEWEAINEKLAQIGYQVVQVQPGILNRLSLGTEGIVDKDAVSGMDAGVYPNDPEIPQQWYLTATGVLSFIIDKNTGVIHASGGPNGTVPPTPVKIALLDSGIPSHEDLPPPTTVKEYAKGTHPHALQMAGLIAATTDNHVGGGSPLSDTGEFHSIVVLDENNTGSYPAVAAGIMHAADQGYHVISMSIGGRAGMDNHFWQLIDDAMRYAISVNPDIIFVVSAGNSGAQATCLNPIACHPDIPNLVVVGAYDQAGDVTHLSSSVPGMEQKLLLLPGEKMFVLSQKDGEDSFTYTGGTSTATAFAAGIIAEFVNLGVPPLVVQEGLFETAVAISESPTDPRTGRGKGDIPALVNMMIEDGYLGEFERTFFPYITGN